MLESAHYLYMNERKGFSRELQLSLGEKLQELYSALLQSIPLHLLLLARRVRDPDDKKETRSSSALEMLGHTSGFGFDSEAVTILDEAYEKHGTIFLP